MLWTIAVILAVLWVIGLITSNTLGGLIHVLIFAAVVLLLVRILKAQRHQASG